MKSSRTETQADEVLKVLKHKGKVTSLEAVADMGILQLPGTIHNLRSRGHQIDLVWKKHTNRYGKTTRYGVYYYRGITIAGGPS